MKKYVYLFREANGKDKATFGGKGANLAEMTNLGMPVPEGFTITTEACTKYYDDGRMIAPEIISQTFETLAIVEKETGKKFGDAENPFLVSVRSGSRASMPGMMDTILNLGLNDISVQGLAKKTNNPRFAYDCYRRFIQMYSDVVCGLGKSFFEVVIDELKEEKGIKLDTEFTAADLQILIAKYKAFYLKEKGEEFPQDPKEQLVGAIEAVFRSWDNPRAVIYRRMNDIPSSWGTAVNVQSMVFGNMGDTSGTGVAFTRDPSTGEKKLYGEYLMNAQGEDVVAGIRTPSPIEQLKMTNEDVYNQFVAITEKLEAYFRDMQDMEFTIEEGKLYMLQTRNGKRTAHAAIRIACELVDEGLITKEEALLKIEPKQLDELLHPMFDKEALKAAKPIASGLAASPGAACGKVCFSAEEATERAGKDPVILVRLETSPEDIEGMNVAKGILTARGGRTSHAAVVARGMGRCCVAGCGALIIDEEKRTLTVDGITYGPDDFLSLDGSTGNIYAGQIKTVEAEIAGYFGRIMGWANEVRRLKVRANADTPADALNAKKFGAEGIGLCRTEHMFFAEDRIMRVREMIISKTVEQRENALKKLLPMQREDFVQLYEAMGDYPVTIRFLDPPLHEFLPTKKEDIESLAKTMKVSFETLSETIESLHEVNPMLGHRGCRLAVTYPEIAAMQTRAVIEAAIIRKRAGDKNIVPEIMIPLVGDIRELKYVKDIVVKTAEQVMKEKRSKVKYMVGTMIEIPRAALTADEIAKEAEFFSFGTNDLTQMTYGFSRDDAAKFLEDYYARKIFEQDPFQKVDQIGVGKLMKMAIKDGRKTRKKLKCGICGEHGGDPATVEFCDAIGLNYVSCSPFRVPIAILAAAQAVLKSK